MKATACGCIFVHAFVCMWEAPLPIYTHANKRQGVKCASGRLLPPTPDSPEYAPKACWFAILVSTRGKDLSVSNIVDAQRVQGTIGSNSVRRRD
ncbi:MAG: hypothetical protein Q9199_007702 [Rusavskia elegans]